MPATLAASPASAVIVHLPGGKTLSYQPLQGAPAKVTSVGKAVIAKTPGDRFTYG